MCRGRGQVAPFDAGVYPAEVQKALRYANDECKANGGGEATNAASTVTTLDLTGDGRDDYIIQFSDTKCSAWSVSSCSALPGVYFLVPANQLPAAARRGFAPAIAVDGAPRAGGAGAFC